MNLLPRTHHEFGNKDYWEKFFKKRGAAAFEWYGEYPRLCGVLSKYIKTADSVLVIGCGNSDLSADMYDVGYHNIINIDISATVINQMSQKHLSARPDMKFIQMDLLQTSFTDAQFSVVLDKGTLDAIFTDDSASVHETVNKMATELGRVLRVGGRYVCISLAQDHILQHIIAHFSQEGWMTRVCRVPDEESDSVDSELKFPVFAFVFTKFRKLPNMKPIYEISYFEDQTQRFETMPELIAAVKEIQQYSMIRTQVNKGHVDEQLSLDLYSSSSSTSPRYSLYVVDTKKRMKNKFAIFIVPQGRETEWLFSSDEGRRQLQQTAGYERLIVVLLNRDHVYNSLDEVKAELSSKVLELAPAGVGKQSPFLSVGDDINLRTVRHRGQSELSGDFVVEDVTVGDQTLRRLVFLSNQNLVQSEARLGKAPVNKKKGGKKSLSSEPIVDHNHMTSSYGGSVVAGLAFIDNLSEALERGIQCIFVGLGGGGIPMYLKTNISKMHIEVVELDPSVLTVATNWFGLVQDDQLKVNIGNGLEYIKQLGSNPTLKHTKDVIVLDVDSKDPSLGMSCPPKEFLEASFLQNIHQLLKPSGLLILNLVCRSKELRDGAIESLKAVFSTACSVKIPEDVNETLFCLPGERTPSLTDSSKLSTNLTSALKTIQETLNLNKRVAATDVLRVAPKLENLTPL